MKNTRNLAIMAMLTALAVVLVYFIHIPIFPPPWNVLEYDPADIPILFGAMLFGPGAGIVLTIAASGIQALTVSAQSGVVGFFMHVFSTGGMVLVASLLHKKFSSKKGAAISLAFGALTAVLLMIPLNLIITPLFFNVPVEFVMNGLIPFIIPFNVMKAFGNAFVAFILYERLGKYIKKTDY